MALIDKSKIDFVTSTNLMNIKYTSWNLNGANTNADGTICNINSGGMAFTINTNKNILKSSKYLKIEMDIISSNIGGHVQYDYRDLVAVELILDYEGTSVLEPTRESVRVALNKYNCKSGKFEYIVEVANRNYDRIKTSIINKSVNIVSVGNIKIYRSKDVTEQSLIDAGGVTGFDKSFIEIRTDNPSDATPGRIWFRIDL